MCGIAGIVRFDGRAVDPALLKRISGLLRHRGPDDEGYLVAGGEPWCGRNVEAAPRGNIALVHRRLSIIDLSDGGWQPMQSADGRFALIFNGEIYNYLELRDALARDGCAFASRSDTEVLLQGLIRHGTAFLSRLVGMFAFALFDRERRTILLARDFAGMKPLYIAANAETFAFSSEIKPLLAIRGERARAHPAALHAFLAHARSDLGGPTMFAGIEAIPPGHYLQVPLDRPGMPQPVAFWQPPARIAVGIGFEEAAERVRLLFLESVRVHLRSDVPLGAALSGGIDSTAIVMAMRRELGQAADIHTFSYVAGDGAPNEEAYSDLASAAARTVHHKVSLQPGDLAGHLDRLIALQEEPFASTSIFAQQRVFAAMRGAGIVVSLDGQGADEYLGGYPTFFAAAAASLLRRGRVPAVFRLLANARSTDIGLTGLAARLAGHFVGDSFLAPVRRLAGKPPFPAPMNAGWFTKAGVVDNPGRGEGASALHAGLIEAFTRTSLPALLRYADRNAMHVSLESRMPFLTPQLVEAVLSLPADMIVSARAETKSVFRRAMRGLVPDVVLRRSDKVGFVTPETKWVTAIRPWVETLIDGDAARHVAAVDLARLRTLWQDALAGRGRVEGPLWRALSVLAWARHFEIDFSPAANDSRSPACAS